MSAGDEKDGLEAPESGPPTVHAEATRFWVEYRGHQFELRVGELVIGRSAGCQLVLDDALVSRRHARIVRGMDDVVLEDLGSANGVFLNGARIDGSAPLTAGDRIVIGQQEMVLRTGNRFGQKQQRERFMAVTLSGVETQAMLGASRPPVPAYDAPEPDSTHTGDALTLLGGVADKVLALGRGDEAERILAVFLSNLIERARAGQLPPVETAERAGQYAVKLAFVTSRAKWVDFCIELYTLLGRPMPAAIVDELYRVLRQVRDVNQAGLRLYVSALRAKQKDFGPAERFLVQRIEGLERLAGL